MTAWYEQSFGEDYLLVYKHRDYTGALSEVRAMLDWLALAPGSKVLDLCCGMGRHSLALTRYGYRVTGVDLSRTLLEEARKLDVAGAVQWVHGDMRQVPLDAKFDAVVNLFTSFGYFDSDEEQMRVLREMNRLLKMNGRFLIDFLNPAYVRRTLVPSSERMDGDVLIKELRRIEDGYVKKEIAVCEPGSAPRHYFEQVRLYELSDFQRMMAGTSLEIDGVHGDYAGSPYSEEQSPRLILFGTKKGRDDGISEIG